ncbi:MAG: NADP-dependent oxidoreductase, partial [Pseudomonadota bacterium]
MTTIAEIRLKQRCEGVPQASDFEAASTDVPPVTDGQVLVRNHYLSLDPYLRGKISGRHMSGAVHPGEVMAGETVG